MVALVTSSSTDPINMKRIFPGHEIGSFAQMREILARLRETETSCARQAVSVTAATDALTEQLYLLYYKHPVHDAKDRLFEVERHELITFVNKEFDEERMDGVDIVVTNFKMGHFLIGNHDGQLFLVR